MEEWSFSWWLALGASGLLLICLPSLIAFRRWIRENEADWREDRRRQEEAAWRKSEREERRREARRRGRRRPIAGLDSASWRELVAEASNTCCYCGRHFHIKHLVREHDVPLSRGGRNARANIVVACKHCNSLKGTQTGPEFRDWLKRNPWAKHWRLTKHKPTLQRAPRVRPMRTARTDLAEALADLSLRQVGEIPAGAIVERALARGSTYRESTLKAVLSSMGSEGLISRTRHGHYASVPQEDLDPPRRSPGK